MLIQLIFPFQFTAKDLIVWSENLIGLPESADWRCIELGRTFDVDLTHTGLADVDKPLMKLYLRQACIDLVDFLTADKRVCLITGCPGVGKSVEVFSYTSWLARNMRYLYIHADSLGGVYIIFKKERESPIVQLGRITRLPEKPENLEKLILDSLSEKIMIVLDGALSWLIAQVLYPIRQSKNESVLITCTSFQCLEKMNSESFFKSSTPLHRHTMESWTREEYRSAITSGALQETALDEKYYYAGGSVRYFQQPIENLIVFLKATLNRVSNVENLLGNGIVGDASEDAVNSLTAIYKNHDKDCFEKVIVSNYVTLLLFSNKVSNTWVGKARSMLPGNPAWQGWVTEFEVLTMIEGSKQVTFYDIKDKSEIWRIESHVSNMMVSFTDDSDTALKQNLGWFRPLKWNQACFDVLFRESTNALKVIQITGGKRHSCKLESLIPFVKAMNVYIIDFVFVCRRDNFSNFVVFDPKKHRKHLENYEDLKKALEGVLSTQKKRGRNASAELIFRKVCYEKLDSVGLDIILT